MQNFIEQRTPEKITENKTILTTPIGLPKIDPKLLKTSPQKFNSPKISKIYQDSILINLNSELDLKNQKISKFIKNDEKLIASILRCCIEAGQCYENEGQQKAAIMKEFRYCVEEIEVRLEEAGV